jgi:hypothetical protein
MASGESGTRGNGCGDNGTYPCTCAVVLDDLVGQGSCAYLGGHSLSRRLTDDVVAAAHLV